MKVNKILTLLGDRPLSDVSPEGMQIIDLINKYSPNKYDISTLTGFGALDIISALKQEQKLMILDTQLNDGLDLTAYRKELQNLVTVNDGSRWMRPLLAFGFSTLMAVLALGYAVAVGWVAYMEKTLPDWPSLLIVIGGPVMVVWQYYGILTQERRDMLVTALGRTPQGSVFNAMGIFNDLKVRGKLNRDDGDRRSTDDTYDPSSPRR